MISWTFEGGAVPTNVVVNTVGTTSTLQIGGVAVNNRGRYTCLARDTQRISGEDVVREGDASAYLEVNCELLHVNQNCYCVFSAISEGH